MTDPGCAPADPPESAAYHVIRGNPEATARDLIDRQGAAALGYAIDQEVEARAFGNLAATAFWSRVCFAVIQLRLAEDGEPAPDPGAAGGVPSC